MVRVVESTSYVDRTHIITVDEFIEGFTDNMFEDEITAEIKHINKIVNKLRCVSYSSCYVMIDDELLYDPRSLDYRTEVPVDKTAYLCDLDGIKYVYEIKSGIGYYYFQSEESALNYASIYDEIEHDY